MVQYSTFNWKWQLTNNKFSGVNGTFVTNLRNFYLALHDWEAENGTINLPQPEREKVINKFFKKFEIEKKWFHS